MNQKQLQLEIFCDDYKTKKINQTTIIQKEILNRQKFPIQLCISVASGLILVIIAFALGVERGRFLSEKKITVKNIIDTKIDEKKLKTINNDAAIKENEFLKSTLVSNKSEEMGKNSSISYFSDNTIISVAVKNKSKQTEKLLSDINKNIEKKEKNVTIKNSKYTIQLATYKKNSPHIKEEVSKLKQKGYVPFMMESGEYLVVYTGEFIDKIEAQTQLNKLKRTYKDCLIKKI